MPKGTRTTRSSRNRQIGRIQAAARVLLLLHTARVILQMRKAVMMKAVLSAHDTMINPALPLLKVGEATVISLQGVGHWKEIEEIKYRTVLLSTKS